MELEKNFAINLKNLRKKYNLTQKELSEAIGCSEKAISKWGCGLSIPDIDILFSLSKAFKTNIESLFSENDKIYLLGIDGGGTKTALLLCDLNGEPIRKTYTDCSNPIDIGYAKTTAVLKKAIYEICEDIPLSSVVCFAGIAGSTSGDFHNQLNGFFSEFGFFACKHDTDNANIISAGLGDRNGITLILGTGVCSFLSKNGIRTQIAGNGYFIDNGGSGYDIGRDALIAYYREKDGYGEKNEITRLICESGYTAPKELLGKIYAEGKKFIASFSRFVFEAAKLNDETAHRIIKDNMKAASEFVLVNAEKLEEKTIPLVVSGGLTKDPLTLSYLKSALGNKYCFDIKPLDREPVFGAILLAKKLYKEISENE